MLIGDKQHFGSDRKKYSMSLNKFREGVRLGF